MECSKFSKVYKFHNPSSVYIYNASKRKLKLSFWSKVNLNLNGKEVVQPKLVFAKF